MYGNGSYAPQFGTCPRLPYHQPQYPKPAPPPPPPPPHYQYPPPAYQHQPPPVYTRPLLYRHPPPPFMHQSRSGSASERRTAEILCAVQESVWKPTIEETLALLGGSMSKIDESIAYRPNPESKEAIEGKFAELNRQVFELLSHRTNIEKLTEKYEEEVRRLRPYVYEFERAGVFSTAVIPFVRLVETANQYFDYKLRAQQEITFNKQGFPKFDEVHRTLLQHHGGFRLQFSSLNESLVKDVANAIYQELICEYHQRPVPTLPPEDQPLLYNWFFRLVSRARRGDYVMDRDPEVELKKMMKNESSVYDRHFLIERLPAEYNNISKLEAYDKYSEIVQSITTMGKEALEERQKSACTITARDGEAFDQNHKVTSTAIGARNKEAVDDEKHEVPSIVTSAKNKEAIHEKQVLTSTYNNAIDRESKLRPVTVISIPQKRKRDQASERGWVRVLMPLEGLCRHEE